MSNSRNRAILALIVGFGLLALQASAVERTVHCDKGQSIQDVLDTTPAASNDRFTVAINGICKETVTIRREMVTIDGNIGPTGPAIEGTVRIFAHNVRLQFLTITGPGPGVIVSGGNSSARLNVVDVTQNDEDGLLVRRGASVWLNNSRIFANGRSGAFVDASILEARNSTFEGNAIDGILAVTGSRVVLANSRVLDNQGAGVALTLHSVLDIRSGSKFADNHVHGVLARLDSAVWISQQDVDFVGSIDCLDFESSFHTDYAWPSGPVNCSPF